MSDDPDFHSSFGVSFGTAMGVVAALGVCAVLCCGVCGGLSAIGQSTGGEVQGGDFQEE